MKLTPKQSHGTSLYSLLWFHDIHDIHWYPWQLEIKFFEGMQTSQQVHTGYYRLERNPKASNAVLHLQVDSQSPSNSSPNHSCIAVETNVQTPCTITKARHHPMDMASTHRSHFRQVGRVPPFSPSGTPQHSIHVCTGYLVECIHQTLVPRSHARTHPHTTVALPGEAN